jgi:HEAT repeat protein
LTKVQPPGGRPMPAPAWLRGRPDPTLTDFWLDARLPARETAELVRLAVAEWDSGEEWAPYLAALGWRGTPDVLEALAPLAGDPDPRARSVAAYVAGELGAPVHTQPAASAALLERMGEDERDPRVLAVIAEAFGHLGEPWGHDWLLRMRGHPDAGVRDGVAAALAGRSDPPAVDALIALSADPDPAIRDWATFALGTLAADDSAALRDALAARLGDAHAEARVESVHGLALRGDLRAVEPALELLAAGAAGGSVWSRHALQEAAIRLAALSGDPRFAPHLPALDDGWRGTTLEHELERALERCAR